MYKKMFTVYGIYSQILLDVQNGNVARAADLDPQISLS